MADLLVRQERELSEEEIAFCERSIPDVFDEVAARDPEALALGGEERATYGELAAAADRVACGVLERLGGGPEPVGLAFRSMRGLMAALVGVLKAGKFVMPLDLSAPKARFEACLVDAGARLVLGDVASVPTGAVVAPDALGCTSNGGVRCDADGDSPALLIYTSGSTGEPKGVLTRQASHLHSTIVGALRMELGPGSRYGNAFSLSFAGGYEMLFTGLLSGSTVLRYEAAERGLAGLPRWISEHDVTATGLLPSILSPVAAAAGPRGLPSLRYLGFGAEILAASDALLARRLLAPTARLGYGYGMAEAGTACAICLDDSFLTDGSVLPVGPACPGKTIRLADVEDGVGEIVVTSRYLAHGYWRREEETARAFSVDPVSGERSYTTGDFGRIDEQGRLIIVGRRDRMVKSRRQASGAGCGGACVARG